MTKLNNAQLHRQTISTGKKELTDLKKVLTAFKENVMPNLEQVVRNAGAPPIEDN